MTSQHTHSVNARVVSQLTNACKMRLLTFSSHVDLPLQQLLGTVTGSTGRPHLCSQDPEYLRDTVRLRICSMNTGSGITFKPHGTHFLPRSHRMILREALASGLPTYKARGVDKASRRPLQNPTRRTPAERRGGTRN